MKIFNPIYTVSQAYQTALCSVFSSLNVVLVCDLLTRRFERRMGSVSRVSVRSLGPEDVLAAAGRMQTHTRPAASSLFGRWLAEAVDVAVLKTGSCLR